MAQGLGGTLPTPGRRRSGARAGAVRARARAEEAAFGGGNLQLVPPAGDEKLAKPVTEVELSTGSTVRTAAPAAWIAETVRTRGPGDIIVLDFADGHGRAQQAFVRVGFVAAVRSL
jgi:hypothetical protein